MLKKNYRIREKEVKKVLAKWKPFFSYWIVLNYIKNNLLYNRFAIIIWSKSVENNVIRNYYRRTFYDLIFEKNWISLINLGDKSWIDFVFVVKKKTKLKVNDIDSLDSFKKDIIFLLDKVN
jgi:ribonuclease P protein component